MRWLVVSVAIHALVVCLLVGDGARTNAPATQPATNQTAVEDKPLEIAMISLSAEGGSSQTAGKPVSRSVHVGSTRARSTDPWSGLSIHTEGRGDGQGNGQGEGHGNGIGFGDGGGVRVARDVPPPPMPVIPPPSKARPAKLIWPNRDLEVADESYLFVAKVTVDEDGSVVGARMLTSRPGSRAEQAADAIWSFRYLPALDERGVPVRSSFEQPFQVR